MKKYWFCNVYLVGEIMRLGRLQLLSCAREGGAVELWERRTDGGSGLWRENWEWRWAKNWVWERTKFFCILGFMYFWVLEKIKKIRIFFKWLSGFKEKKSDFLYFIKMMLMWKIVVLAETSVLYIIYILVTNLCDAREN